MCLCLNWLRSHFSEDGGGVGQTIVGKGPKSCAFVWVYELHMGSIWRVWFERSMLGGRQSGLSLPLSTYHSILLPPPKKEVMFLVRSVCLSVCLFVSLFVCLSVGLLANLWTDFDEIFCRCRAWLKDQVIQFWWRSGSRFGSGSPKSEIRILRIAMFGGGLCSLSISSLMSYHI